MIVLLIGAPGAGKGTQADLLVERLGFQKLSTGDILRRHVTEGSDLGNKAKVFMNEGKLVPDDVLLGLVNAELSASRASRILLDGYPRNIAQVQDLEKLRGQHPIGRVIYLDVNRDELKERLTGRRVCSKCSAIYHVRSNPSKTQGICDKCGGTLLTRDDDRIENVEKRLKVYEESTVPVIEFYKSKNICADVNALGSTDEVFKRILDIIEMKSVKA